VLYLLGFICNKLVTGHGATRSWALCTVVRVKLTSQLVLPSCWYVPAYTEECVKQYLY